MQSFIISKSEAPPKHEVENHAIYQQGVEVKTVGEDIVADVVAANTQCVKILYVGRREKVNISRPDNESQQKHLHLWVFPFQGHLYCLEVRIHTDVNA